MYVTERVRSQPGKQVIDSFHLFSHESPCIHLPIGPVVLKGRDEGDVVSSG